MSYETLNEKLLKGKKEEKYFVSVVPVTEFGEVLLGKRTEDGIWTTPGGGADPGEEPHEAARRELFEEAGLAAQPNSLELVSVSETPRGFKIWSFLWRMPKALGEIATSKLDPDKEVKSWKLYRPEDFPSSMSEEKNASRLKTIREALMRLYAVKSEDDAVLDLADKLGKGGPGSGIKGHRTARDKLNEKLKNQGVPKEKWYLYTNRHVRREESVGVDALGNDLHPGQEQHRAYAGMPQTRDSIAQEKRKKDLEKGGPGSGVVGHVTARKPSEHHPSINGKPLPPQSKLKVHLQSLKHGGVMPGLQTQSGKPIANDMSTARAHGYDVQDHVDAMNAHYELAQRTNAILEKLKTAGHKVPTEGQKILDFHNHKVREHMNARTFLEERKKRVEEKLKDNADKRKEHVKKSVTQMGGAIGDRDLDIGSFAQANGQGHVEWLERLYNLMEGFSYGDDPRDVRLDHGTLHLAKVDDGLYTGYYTRDDEAGLLDNMKVRIERITIPELVQFMIAKEWISNHKVESQPEEPTPVEPPPQTLPDVQETQLVALAQTLRESEPTVDSLAQKIKLLELVSKLIS